MLSPLLGLILPLASLFASSNVSMVESKVEEDTTTSENNAVDPNAIIFSTGGLVTVGAAGSVIVAINSKKEKNVPVKEEKSSQKGDE